VDPSGEVSETGDRFTYVRTPFRFCQNCRVSYRARRRESDFGKLATLASGGRSTATTILSLSAVRLLRAEDTLQDHAKKLLSFTDNRQDASLQAGHFNDFVEVGLLRAALFKACVKAGEEGLSHDELAQARRRWAAVDGVPADRVVVVEGARRGPRLVGSRTWIGAGRTDR
jgi:hypothetical protein